jgi:hypothetical protein
MSKFEMGQLVATPAALEVLEESRQTPIDLLRRHCRGDWGDLSQSDKQSNEEALEQELPELLNGLAGLGVTNGQGGLIIPVRFPMEDETLADLRKASQASGLDQFQLFMACLSLATRRKRRRGEAAATKKEQPSESRTGLP